MRDLTELNAFRNHAIEEKIMGRILTAQERLQRESYFGAFVFPSPIDRQDLRCIVSAYRPHDPSEDGSNPPWNQVSVSRKKRTPSWGEMEFIKRKFFQPHEVAMQLHVGESDHLSYHDNCLHIWQPALADIPLPPTWMVAPTDDMPEDAKQHAKEIQTRLLVKSV